MYKSICPICGEELQGRSWYDESSMVETDRKCFICGYHENWSYGYTGIEFGKYIFDFGHKTSNEEYMKIEKLMNKARWKFRKALLRKRIIKGRKYAKYF